MIPSRKEAKPVILNFLLDGRERSSEEVQEMIATHFALTEEERTRKRGKGAHPEYVNETAWALVDLQRDGLIKKPEPEAFVYRITDSGRHAAEDGSLGTPIPPRHPA
jgi:restriction endonuclease Mrr